MTRQLKVNVNVSWPNRSISGIMSITCKDVPEQFEQDAMGLAMNVMQQVLNDTNNSFLAIAVPITGTEQVTLSLVAKSAIQTIDVLSAAFIDEPVVEIKDEEAKNE